jgi:hypothetical protein
VTAAPADAFLRETPRVREEVAFLWAPRALNIYFELLSECCNPDTVEAVVGCLQNLTACEWRVWSSTLLHADVVDCCDD